jgi:Arc/MetJ-type ribon-helix-helix transcriptional regulator
MSMNRITIRIGENYRKKIEERIKKEYPKVKNISELVRVALEEFLTST